MDFKAGLAWSKSHPWEAGGLVFVIAIGAFVLLHKGGGSGASGPDASLGAYLQAETAQNASDNALVGVQAQLNAATAVAGINAKQAVDTNNIWAKAGLETTAANNDNSQKNSLISYFGQLANNLGTVLTKSSGSTSSASGGGGLSIPGIFSIGGQGASSSGSSSSSQMLVANDQQANAEHELSQISSALFHPGS